MAESRLIRTRATLPEGYRFGDAVRIRVALDLLTHIDSLIEQNFLGVCMLPIRSRGLDLRGHVDSVDIEGAPI